MNYQLDRITLAAQTHVHREPVFDVVMIGHTEKMASLTQLFANVSMINDMHNAGYSELLNKLSIKKTSDEKKTSDDKKNSGDVKLAADFLFNVPIPIRSEEEFTQLFSVASVENTAYRYSSRLGGDYAWLPLAVADFFKADVLKIPRRLWIIPVNEQEGLAAFVTPDLANFPSIDENNAFLRALSLPNVALIAMPDFERLHIPAALKPIPMLRMINPIPAFLPCGSNANDGVKERSIKNKNYIAEGVSSFAHNLKSMLSVIAKYRQDISLLVSFPFDETMDGELPRTSILIEEKLREWRNSSDKSLLRRAQFLYPYLQDTQGNLSSPAGVIAGKILATTTAKGSWRSAAGSILATNKRPFPILSPAATSRLRNNLGLGVIHYNQGYLELDDERLAVPYFENEMASNSGELARFMGWLLRALEKLGLELVFEGVDVALKCEILLRHFFNRLYAMGALRGKSAENAFSVNAQVESDSRVVVDIAIAPAFAIDTIVLDFRFENGSLHNMEIKNG
jgi:hypothetical protein